MLGFAMTSRAAPLLVALAGIALGIGLRGTGQAATPRGCPPGNLGTIAFVRGGSLVLLDLHGCRTRTLVKQGAAGPVQLSFDGRYVAFAGGIVSSRGGGVRRIPGTGTWSPRADLLAVVTARGGLDLVRPGRPKRRLLPDRWGAVTVAFAPSGRRLAVSRSRYRAGTPWKSWHQEIWLVDVRTGARRMIFRLRPKQLAPPLLQGFSPDGRRLLFWEDSQNSGSLAADGLPLLALPASGGKAVAIRGGELHYPDFLDWCGKTLVYVLNHGGRQVTLGDGLAAAAPPGWRSRTILPPGGQRSWNSVTCGSDGLVVAGGPTTRDTPFGHEHRSLWLVSPTPGARPQRLSQADPPKSSTDELPMWSGDGRWLLFVRTTRSEGALYALDPFGGNLVGPIARIGKSGSYYGHYGWASQLDWHR